MQALLALPPAGAIPLSGGYLDADLQPAAALGAALARAARQPASWQRGPAEGRADLRAWFAREAGGGLRADDLVICPGGQAALSTALRALAAPGDTVLVESPTYLGALAAARAAGLRVVPVPADADGVRPDQLAAAFARTGARLFYCQPLHANPHGATLAAHRRAQVAAAVRDAGAFLIEDDYARDLTIDGEAAAAAGRRRPRRPRRLPALADQVGRARPAGRRDRGARPGRRPAAHGPAARRLLRHRPAAAGHPGVRQRAGLDAAPPLPAHRAARPPRRAAGRAAPAPAGPRRAGGPPRRPAPVGPPTRRHRRRRAGRRRGGRGRRRLPGPPLVRRRATGAAPAPHLRRRPAGPDGRGRPPPGSPRHSTRDSAHRAPTGRARRVSVCAKAAAAPRRLRAALAHNSGIRPSTGMHTLAAVRASATVHGNAPINLDTSM